MNYIDYIIILFLIVGFLLGFRDGLVRKIIGLIGLILGIVLAFEFAGMAGKYFTLFFNNDESLAIIVSGIMIFVVVVLIAAILKRLIHPLDKVNRFINQFIGGVIGVIQISFFISGLFLMLNIFGFPNDQNRKDSALYNSFSEIIPVSFDFIIGHRSKATDYIKDYIFDEDIKNNIEIDTNITKP